MEAAINLYWGMRVTPLSNGVHSQVFMEGKSHDVRYGRTVALTVCLGAIFALFVRCLLSVWRFAYLETVYTSLSGKQFIRTAGRIPGRADGINFALGVATGLAMGLSLGTELVVLLHYVGDIFTGTPLAHRRFDDGCIRSTL